MPSTTGHAARFEPLDKPEAPLRRGARYAGPRGAHGAHVRTSGNVLELRIGHPNGKATPHKRGDRKPITAWSRSSRNALRTNLHRPDWSARSWAYVTLTLPGDLAPCDFDPKRLKRLLRAYLKRVYREAHRPLLYLWKLEYQRRGAAHFAIVLELPTNIDWLRRITASHWHELAGRGQPNHLAAGTHVSFVHNNQRIAAYLSKELGASISKEYQHLRPQQIEHPGRWWGCSRHIAPCWPAPTPLSYEDAYRIRRAARRLTKSTRHAHLMDRRSRYWLGRTELHTGPPAAEILDRLLYKRPLTTIRGLP